MKVIIVEDEKLSAEHLVNLLKKIDASIQVLAQLDAVKQTIDWLTSNPPPDLIFLDIHLADGISFDIFSKISIETPIVFTTAYNEYAVKAFKLNSVDYLLKPIDLNELKTAIEKYKKQNSFHLNKINPEWIANTFNVLQKQYKTRFLVKIADQIIPLKIEEILFFIAEDGIVLLVAKNGKRYPIDYTLDTLETLLNPDLFFRINRKILLCVDSIQKVNVWFNSRLKLEVPHLQGEECIVSRERALAFKTLLDK